jgi:hypothetical protein
MAEQPVRNVDWQILHALDTLQRWSRDSYFDLDAVRNRALLSEQVAADGLRRLSGRGLAATYSFTTPRRRALRTAYRITPAGSATMREPCLCGEARSEHVWGTWRRTDCRQCECMAFNDGSATSLITSTFRSWLTRQPIRR